MANEMPIPQGETAEGRPGSTTPGTTLPGHRRHISPWALVGLGALLFCLAFAIVAGIAVLVRPATRPVVRGLQERTMPDGTILVLEKVTVGMRHQFDWEHKASFTDWINGVGTQKHTANASVPTESIVVWFSRRDPATGACLDVDWWLRSAAVDDFGGEIEDEHAGRDSFSPLRNSGLSGSRPFSPEPPGNYDLIVAHSALRPFRHSGTSFKLRVYDRKGEAVAEFDVPHTTSAPLPVWEAEPLPATKKADDLDITLTGMAVDSSVHDEGSWKRLRYNVRPEFTISRDGQPEAIPSVPDLEFEDAFGNRAYQWDCQLNFSEPAWKLKVKLWPGDKAPSRPGGEWTVAGLALPEATKVNLVRQKKTIEGVAVELVAAGGGDMVVYSDSAPAGGEGSSSNGGTCFGKLTYNIETRTRRGSATTTINCKLPHLLLRPSGLDPDHRLVIRVQDDQGRDVPAHQPFVGDQMVVFLQPAADARTIDVTHIVQQPKKVEFFVKPPRVTHEERGK